MEVSSLHLHLPVNQAALLRQLTQELDCTPQQLISSMLDDYLREYQQRAGVRAAIAQAEAGESFSAEEVFAEFMGDAP